MLGEIVAITITVANLAPMEKAYAEVLGYKAVDHGKVSAAMAKAWGTPKVAGHDYVIMQPESGSPHYLRFVVTADYPDYKTLKTLGWNATELLVKDPDAVAAKLKNSPFQIVGEPRPISADGKTKAMQAVGPAKELLYLTNPASETNQASSFVDRVFIVIDGGADLKQLSRFFQDKMGGKVSDPMSMRLSVLNRAYGFDPELKHEIAMARVGGPFSVEMDQYPKEAVARAGRRGDLPPGMSIVSFEVDDLSAVSVPFVQKPAKLAGAPYNGRRVAVVKGPSGELLELVETGKK